MCVMRGVLYGQTLESLNFSIDFVRAERALNLRTVDKNHPFVAANMLGRDVWFHDLTKITYVCSVCYL